MWIPFVTKRSGVVEPRAGGGGKGNGSTSTSSKGGGKGSTSTSSTGSTSGSSSGSTSFTGTKGTSGKTKKSKSIWSTPKKAKNAPNVPVAIPAGQMFAGRLTGGGTRAQVFGSRTYGSGYSSVSGYAGSTGRGVAGRGFPFGFWPIAWGGAAVVSTGAYLHTQEYGLPDNTSRPGGPMSQATFVSPSNTAHVLADNSTMDFILSAVQNNCTLASDPTFGPYDPTASPIEPGSAVQYYRASSIVLTMDGYNNSAAVYAADENVGVSDSPLTNYDVEFLDCLNYTIAATVPLGDGAVGLRPGMQVMGFAWVVIWVLGLAW